MIMRASRVLARFTSRRTASTLLNGVSDAFSFAHGDCDFYFAVIASRFIVRRSRRSEIFARRDSAHNNEGRG